MLVINGEINQTEMRANRVTLDELTEELRNQSVTDISKVKYAVMETDGRLSTILFPAEQPVTAAQMKIPSDDPGYPSILINDGKVMSDNLRISGRDESWLESEMESRKIKSPAEVYIMTINGAGQIYCAPKEGRRRG